MPLYRDKKAVDYKNKGGWTALMYATYYDHVDVVKLLLETSASVHPVNNSGCNALMLAAMCGSESIAEMLIKVSFCPYLIFSLEDLLISIFVIIYIYIYVFDNFEKVYAAKVHTSKFKRTLSSRIHIV